MAIPQISTGIVVENVPPSTQLINQPIGIPHDATLVSNVITRPIKIGFTGSE